MRTLGEHQRARSATAIFAAVALFVAACGGSDETPATPAPAAPAPAPAPTGPDLDPQVTTEDITLTIWIGRADYEPDQTFAAFTERYPNITLDIQLVRLESATTDFFRAFQAGNDPDAFMIEIDTWKALAEAGVIRDMSDMWAVWEFQDKESWDDATFPAFNELKDENGSWGWVSNTQPHAMAYRTDYFAAAGLKYPPKTWEDVLTAARALATDSISGYGMSFARRGPRQDFYTHYFAMGGQVVDNLPLLSSEAGVYMCDFWQTLHRERLISPESFTWGSGDYRGQFMAGNIAQVEGGPNVLPRFAQELDYGTQWDVIPNPYREGAQADYRQKLVSVPYLVSANTEYPYETSLLFRWLAEPEIAFSIARRYLPATSVKVLTEMLPEEQPWMRKPEMQAAFGIGVENFVQGVPSHPQALEVAEVLNDFVQACGQRTTEPAAIISAEHDARLAPFR